MKGHGWEPIAATSRFEARPSLAYDPKGRLWIAYEEGTIPPSYVYIELNDRQTNTKYKSNLADTTP